MALLLWHKSRLLELFIFNFFMTWTSQPTCFWSGPLNYNAQTYNYILYNGMIPTLQQLIVHGGKIPP